MTNYVIDMAENTGVTVMTETRNLRALPFLPNEDQLSTGKAWEEWLDDIEREFRYFRISSPTDRKDAMVIYGGKEIARLEKSLSDPDDPNGRMNEYEKLRKKLNDYFSPRQNKHYSRYMFLKLRPLAGEATIAYAARLRERAYDCDFGDTFDDRILEHLIQTIENKHLIQKCIAKCWNLAQFLSEAGQIEDISLQVHDMKDARDDRYVARVDNSRKQKHYRNHRSSDEDDVEMICRHCGYDRKHRTIEDCPAYGQKCHRCQKLNHFASVCKSQRSKDEKSKQKNQKKRIRNICESNRIQKMFDTDTSDSSDDDFISKSAAHMLRIKTVKSGEAEETKTCADFLQNENGNVWDNCKQYKEQIELMKYEMQRHARDIELKLDQKLKEFFDQIRSLSNTHACSLLRNETINMQTKDDTDDAYQSKSPLNEVNEQSQRQTQNDESDLHIHDSCDSINEGTERDESDMEDSLFIEGGGRTTTRVQPIRKGRKRRNRKSHC